MAASLTRPARPAADRRQHGFRLHACRIAAMNSPVPTPRVAVVGASGAVGSEILTLPAERAFPLSELRLYSSARSAGRRVSFRGEELVFEQRPEGGDLQADIVFSSAGGSVSRRHAWDWANAGATVIDITSAWRLDDRVPLVVPEVNADAAREHNGIRSEEHTSELQSRGHLVCR